MINESQNTFHAHGREKILESPDINKLEDAYNKTGQQEQEARELKFARANKIMKEKNEAKINMVVLYIKELDKIKKLYVKSKDPVERTKIEQKINDIRMVIDDLGNDLPKIDKDLANQIQNIRDENDLYQTLNK
ncbi:hypothetical protein KJ641_01815 [Patescibacteria group bacterium]|nr:hypothetical protein [Patescibacteria group bacterium]MBU1895588.1 hypothetical protein [Patescibacteria group bacterium]